MSIGILNEGPLHAALKAAYVAHGGAAEVPVGTFVADAVRNGIMYEVQTGSFSGLGRKMSALAAVGPIVLVHPIALNTTIVKEPQEASNKSGGKKSNARKLAARKSPKHGALVHIVNELVYLPTMLNHANFSVEVVLTEERVLRRFDPTKRRNRGGWRVVSRELLSIADGMRINAMADLYEFLIADLPEPFSTRQLALALDEPLDIGQKMAYCLKHAGVTEVVGKTGNSLLYENVRCTG